MVKVSTRPRKGATTVTAAATPVAAAVAEDTPPVIVATTALGLVELALRDYQGSTSPEAISIHGHTLAELAQRALQRCAQRVNGDDTDESELLYEAAALLQGAEALDRVDAPTRTKRHAVLRDAYDLVNSATISFGFSREPCEDLADGIKAGRRATAAAAATTSLSGEPADAVVGRDTELPRGGRFAIDLALRCTYDVAAIAEAVVQTSNYPGVATSAAAMLRMYGARIKRLNSVLMSYLGGDSVTLREAHHSFYEGTKELPAGELQ